jgi:hypothetical protein
MVSDFCLSSRAGTATGYRAVPCRAIPTYPPTFWARARESGEVFDGELCWERRAARTVGASASQRAEWCTVASRFSKNQ